MIQDLTVVLPNKRFLARDFTFSEGDNNISTQYDDGTVFKRQATTSAPIDASGTLMLNQFELNVFRDFYKTACNNGALSFYFYNPFETGLSQKTRMYFLEPPTYEAVASNYWNATISLRIFEIDTI